MIQIILNQLKYQQALFVTDPTLQVVAIIHAIMYDYGKFLSCTQVLILFQL